MRVLFLWHSSLRQRADINMSDADRAAYAMNAWLELDNAAGQSVFILREEKDDPSTETRITLHPGMQLVIDTERLWHVVWHPGPRPRYALITSWESGPQLDAYIAKYNGKSRVDSVEVPQEELDAGQAEQSRRIAARAAALAAKGQQEQTKMSEA